MVRKLFKFGLVCTFLYGACNCSKTTEGVNDQNTLDDISGVIAFYSGRSGNNEIYITNADGSGDGNYIVFQSERNGNFEVYIMKMDGSSQTRLTNNSAWDGWASWGVVVE